MYSDGRIFITSLFSSAQVFGERLEHLGHGPLRQLSLILHMSSCQTDGQQTHLVPGKKYRAVSRAPSCAVVEEQILFMFSAIVLLSLVLRVKIVSEMVVLRVLKIVTK